MVFNALEQFKNAEGSYPVILEQLIPNCWNEADKAALQNFIYRRPARDRFLLERITTSTDSTVRAGADYQQAVSSPWTTRPGSAISLPVGRDSKRLSDQIEWSNRMAKEECVRKGKEAGFTIIELLVVVAIIGTLTALSLPNLQRAMNKARTAHTEAEIMGMVSVVRRHAFEGSGCIPAVNAPEFKRWAEGADYYKALDTSDGWGHEYEITLNCESSGTWSVMWLSAGIDGQKFTNDDLVYLYSLPNIDGWVEGGGGEGGGGEGGGGEGGGGEGGGGGGGRG